MPLDLADQALIAKARAIIDQMERGDPDPRGGWDDALGEYNRRRLQAFVSDRQPPGHPGQRRTELEGLRAAIDVLEQKFRELIATPPTE